MNKKINILAIILFMTVLILPSAIWGVKGLTGSKIFETELGENRELAKWPEFISSNIINEVEAYYNDHAPFRSLLIYGYSVVDTALESTYRKSVQPALIKLSGKKGDGSFGNLAEVYNSEQEETVTSKPEEKTEAEPKEPEVSWTETERVEPTCTEEGFIKYTNTEGETKVEGIPALGHDFVVQEVVESTYENYGFTLYKCSRCGKTRHGDFTEKLVDDTYLPENIYNNQVIIGRNDWLFYIGDNSRAYYKGSNVMDENELASNMALMQSLKDVTDARGQQLLFAIWPNKEQVYPEYMPTYTIENVIKREPAYKIYLETNSDINFLYPIDELTKGKLYRDTYYPYDTHWNYWGAYIATMEMYKALGLPASGMEDWEVSVTENVARGLVATGMLDPAGFVDDEDYFVNYRPDAGVSYSEGNRLLMGGYTPVYRANASNPLFDKKIVIIGDSFRISMLTYMEKDFAKVTAVQRENMDQVISDIREADIIVLTAVERFDPDLYRRIPILTEYLKSE